jgi:hypothetical protein
MITGYFFKPLNEIKSYFPLLDTSSNNEENDFIYTPIKKTINSNKDLIDYPIVISFQENNIFFISRFFIKSKDDTKEYYQLREFFNLSCFNDESLSNSCIDYFKSAENILSNTVNCTYHPFKQITYSTLSLSPILRLNEDKKISLSTIFLDFLFDFFHSNVFKSSPHYHKIKSKLETHPFTKALIAKLEYNYFKQRLQKFDEEEFELKEDIEKEYIKATKNWLNIIRDTKYNDIIHPDNKWFEPIETEHFDLYYDTIKTNRLDTKNEHNPWKVFKFDSKQYCQLLKNKNTPINIDIDQAQSSIQWLISRYNLWEAFVLLFSFIKKAENNWLRLSSFSIILIFLIINSFYPVFGIAKIENLADTNIFFKLSYFIFLLPFIAFTTCLIFDTIIDLIKKVKEERLDGLSKWLDTIPRLIQFFKPKILLSSTVVWTAVFTSDRFWNLDFKIGFLESMILIVFLISTYAFMSNKLKELLPISNQRIRVLKISRRASFIFMLGVVYSFIIGISAMSFMSENILTKDKFLQKYIAEINIDKCLINEKITYKNKQDAITTSNLYKTNLSNPLSTLDTYISYNINDSTSATLIDYKILKEVLQPKNIDKELFKYILPSLKQKGSKNRIMIKGGIGVNSSKELAYSRNLYIFPEMLVFYTFITLLIGIFAEMGFGKD